MNGAITDTPATDGLVIDIANQQTCLLVDEQRLREAIARVLTEEGINQAAISLVLVDDPEIHRINNEFLGHDYPTDVISFRLDQDPVEISGTRQERSSDGMSSMTGPLEGELIVSTETALREAPSHGWSPHDELLLYVVHGMLHVCGYDDLTEEARPLMRNREREVLANWHLVPIGLEV